MKLPGTVLGVGLGAICLLTPAAATAQFSLPNNLQSRPAPRDVGFLHPTFKPGLTIEEAHRIARERDRLLVIAFPNEVTGAAADPAWDHPLVRAWINQHAEAVRFVDIRDYAVSQAIYEAVMAQLAARELSRQPIGRGKLPYGAVFKDGKLDFLIGGNAVAKFFTDATPGKMDAGPTTLIGDLHFALEAAASRDPIWIRSHEAKNPPLQPPPMPDFSSGKDDLAPPCTGPAEGETVFDLLHAARRARDGADERAALSMYTWLWEHAPERHPILRPAQSSIIALEFGSLARTSPSAARRLTLIREELAMRELWWGFGAWINALSLAYAMGDDTAALSLAAASSVDEDMEALTSRAARETAELVWSVPWGKPVHADADGLAWLTDQFARLRAPGAPGTHEDDLAQLKACRSRAVFDRACVMHARFLQEGNDADAWRAAELLLANIDHLTHLPQESDSRELYTPAGARAALVATALAFDAPSPRHRALLNEVPQPGTMDWLKGRLDGSLNP